MRAPPAPTLHNVLVSHPATASHAVATQDELLNTAILANDTHDFARPRNMLARVSRRWARLSDSLWRRRNSSRRDLTTTTATTNVTSPTTTNNNPLSLRLRSSRAAARGRQVVAPPVITFQPSQCGPFHAASESDADLRQEDSHFRHPSPDVRAPRTADRIHSHNDVTYHQQRMPTDMAYSDAESAPPTTSPPHPALPPPTHADNPSFAPAMPGGDGIANDAGGAALRFSPDASQAFLSRERELRERRRAELLAVESAADDEVLEDVANASLRDTASRRVRQVGAREDDDTLLLLPRLAAVSFTTSSPSNTTNVTTVIASPSHSGDGQCRPPKVRHLPRVSGLMPMRSTRAPPNDLASPVSSAGKASRAGSDSGGSEAVRSFNKRRSVPERGHSPALYQEKSRRSVEHVQMNRMDEGSKDGEYDDDEQEYDEDEDDSEVDVSEDGDGDEELDEDDEEDEDDWEDDERFINRPLYRLPTGMSNRDVEREMKRAVVEIASDGSDSDEGAKANVVVDELNDDDIVGDDRDVGNTDDVGRELDRRGGSLSSGRVVTELAGRAVIMDSNSKRRDVVKVRSRSDAHDGRNVLDEGFARRASSSVQNGKTVMASDFEGRTVVAVSVVDKSRASRAQDVALFEDDYLSFQGFDGNSGEGRSVGVSSLLRAKRISSVTDSLSDESEEGIVGRLRSESMARRGMLRSGRLPVLRRKWSPMGEGAE